MTQQELSAHIENVFGQFPYRKISYHSDRREILLQFDYPDAQDMAAFGASATAFTEATGWTAQIHPSTNHNAASLLLSALFGDRITKVSYHVDRKTYAVTLSGNLTEEDRTAAEKFHSVTGWSLCANGQSFSSSTPLPSLNDLNSKERDDVFYPGSKSPERIEQNLAFSCIDQTFAGLPHKPDKKSLKQNFDGKYLEISFISPEVANKYREKLQTLSDQTGWCIRIADKVNQNELLKIAQLLCQKYEIPLRKPPPTCRRIKPFK